MNFINQFKMCTFKNGMDGSKIIVLTLGCTTSTTFVDPINSATENFLLCFDFSNDFFKSFHLHTDTYNAQSKNNDKTVTNTV